MILPPIVNGSSSWANSNRTTTVYGQAPTIKLQSGIREGYLSFPLGSTLEPGDTITATLFVPQSGAWTGGRALTARAVARWTTNSLSWNNRPAAVSGSVDHTVTTASTTADGFAWSFDVSADVQAGVLASARRVYFRVRTNDATSREVLGIPGAYLSVAYSRTPAAPTELDPGASRVVSVTKPVLAFNASDVVALRVQVADVGAAFAAATGFASPTFDSGATSAGSSGGIPLVIPAIVSEGVGSISSTGAIVPQYDLSASTYGGLSSTPVSWTATYQNSSGVWSTWATPAPFSYVAKPAATIVSPASAVWEPTPPLSVTMAGLTKARWVVYDTADLGRPVYDSGPLAATSPHTHTPTRDAYTKSGHTYRTVFQGYDNVANRAKNAAVGGDVFTSVTVDSVLSLDATVTGASSTTAVQVGVTPSVDVTAVRAVMPDAFVYMIDGQQIGGDLDPVTLLVTTNTYRYRYHLGSPNVSHRHRLAPKVNGRVAADSDANQHADLTAATVSRWLGDPATGEWVAIAGQDQTWTRPDDATTYAVNRSGLSNGAGGFYPAATLATIRRVRGKQLPTGAVSGSLLSTAFGNGAASIALMQTWADRDASYVYRFAFGDRNVAVTIGDVEVTPVPEWQAGNEVAAVSFSFWSA